MKTFKQFVAEQQHPMIDVDGVQKHRNNSEGNPIHPTDEGIRNFHRWFGDSKTTDKHGRPQVMYHGSTHDFNEFRDDHKAATHGGMRGAYFFTPKKSYAKQYGNPKAHYVKLSKVVPDHFGPDIKKHAIANNQSVAKSAVEHGYDGRRMKTDGHAGTVISYKANHIKSATHNNGAFSDSGNINE